jgi:hypothetical protein
MPPCALGVNAQRLAPSIFFLQPLSPDGDKHAGDESESGADRQDFDFDRARHDRVLQGVRTNARVLTGRTFLAEGSVGSGGSLRNIDCECNIYDMFEPLQMVSKPAQILLKQAQTVQNEGNLDESFDLRLRTSMASDCRAKKNGR